MNRPVAALLIFFSSASAMLTGAVPAYGVEESIQTINVREHGVSSSPDAVAGAAIEGLMKAFPEATLYFPSGRYLLANDARNKDGLRIGSDFHGSMVFAAGASLVCNTATTSAGSCVHLVSASHVSLVDMDIEYLYQQALPMSRADATNYSLLIDASSNIRIVSAKIEASPGACFWASDSTGLIVHDLHVRRCTADGVHFENDRNVDLQDMWSSHTMDDGLAFTNVSVTSPNCGAIVKRVHIEDSSSRGIAVPGGCDIAVSDFAIDRTGVSGILVNTDDAFHMRRPVNVSFRNGAISHAGVLTSSSGGGNKFGIEVSAADHVSFDHVQVLSAESRGFDVSHGSTYVSFTGGRIVGSGDDGINLSHSSAISVSDDVIQDAAGCGTYLSQVSDFVGSHLTYINVSTSRSRSNLHRAFWVDNPAGTTRGQFLKITDDQPVATGYIVGCSNLQKRAFSITGLSSSLRQGRLQIECSGEVTESSF